ncbi:PorP/SprF family type IX secretion system membrane protein [Pontimicrobium sp. SW4]|uniref:PorP/SprF family type IX secretion system membrane protein n=1 Tax=Pontimicrobium sp. SW4 TaxID=3153519 RepID=A0AAU7BRC6_9FLAO
MKINLLIILIFFCAMQLSYSQEDGVASLAIPVRNSLRFNRFVVNPTFSFVREQNKYLSFTNKREWVQFNDAPLTYLASYSGRFRENIGVGVGLFQKNHGVLTSFGGILNFAYNARLQQESNLTFGLNLGVYKSGINEANVVTNVPDPSLDNIPSNFLLSISPGINYGTQFFDLGISVNNLVQYNLKASELIEEDPQQNIQAHIMYTGYMDARGFFDETKFSTLIRSEFRKDNTIISGIAMLTVPKGIWGQVGYNTVYGFSGGIGLNITEQIAIEYNFEKTIGDLETFGSSHDITLAYRFKKKESFYYSDDDEESAFVIPKKRRKVLAKSTTTNADREKRAQAKIKADEDARLAAEAKAKAKADEDARVAAEKLKEIELIANEEARKKAEAAAKTKADEEARIAAEKLKEIELIAKANEKARLAAESKAKSEEEARIAEEKLKEIELKAKAEKERLAAEKAAKAKADEEARIAAEKLKEIELIAKAEEAKLAAETKAKADEEIRIAEEKLKEIELKAKAERERLAAEKAVQFDITHKDELAKTMFNITELAKVAKQKQEDLLTRLNEAVENKNEDLKDLKEENDLSEQGIYKEPKPFKSVTAQNRALEALKVEVDNAISERSKNIEELEKQYNNRLKNVSDKNDATNEYYRNAIKELKDEQELSIRSKASLVSRLEKIDLDLEFERNRRIKRALYDNEEDRYEKDRVTLNQIKQSTEIGANRLLNERDFDFGEERILDNIQIVKDVKHVDEGYYVVLAVHNDVDKRDEFLTKVISAGQPKIDFFYDINSSKYFIYYEKFQSIDEARKAIQLDNGKPYNSKMSIVKIEK